MQIIVDELGLDYDNRLILFSHNLSFEWQWIKHRLPFDDGFSGDVRCPYKVWTYNGLEFRDSLKLSGLSLDMTMKLKVPNSKVHKLTGSWDYTKQRHSKTALTDDEIKYACYDVLCVMEYIQTLMEQANGLISRIPLTRTGYVRNDIKKNCVNDKKFNKKMETLTLEVDEYKSLKNAYAGGFTHANHNYVSFQEEDGVEMNKVLTNVGSFDFTSSYPASLVQFKFPMGIAIHDAPIETEDDLIYYMEHYCVMMDVGFEHLSPKFPHEHILSLSKCIEYDPLHNEDGVEEEMMDNGRIIACDYARVIITEQDYYSLKDFYYWDAMDVYKVTCYFKEYIPTQIVDRILYYYEQKTTLKGVTSPDGSTETLYALYKEHANSIYGMFVEDPIHQAYELVDGEFQKVKDEDPEATINYLLNKYNTKWGRCVYYPWGVWCTAYSRRNLLKGILACGSNYVYSDTDSIKFLLDKSEHFLKYVEEYNEEVKERMEAAMKHHGFDLDRWNPTDIKGNHHPLGYWDREHDMDEFKVLGAKRYFYRIGDKYTSTIAGSNKKATGEYLASQPNPFEAFSIGLKIPAGVSGRLVATYIDEPISGIATDYNGVQAPYDELSAVCLTESEFNMTMSPEFLMYLRGEIYLDFVG